MDTGHRANRFAIAVAHHTWVVVACSLLSACGIDDSSSNSEPARACYGARLAIDSPVENCETYSTAADSVGITGKIPGAVNRYDCVNTFPPDKTIEWRNSSTGESGFGTHSAYCVTNPFTPSGMVAVSRWSIPNGSINLQMGENRIRVTSTAFVPEHTSSISVIRVP